MAQKEAQGVAEKRKGRKGPGSVIGSSAAGCVCSYLSIHGVGGEAFARLWQLGFVDSFCTKLSDTVSSEIGKAYGKNQYSRSGYMRDSFPDCELWRELNRCYTSGEGRIPMAEQRRSQCHKHISGQYFGSPNAASLTSKLAPLIDPRNRSVSRAALIQMLLGSIKFESMMRGSGWKINSSSFRNRTTD